MYENTDWTEKTAIRSNGSQFKSLGSVKRWLSKYTTNDMSLVVPAI